MKPLGPEDGWQGDALHYCSPELFDVGVLVIKKISRECAQAT